MVSLSPMVRFDELAKVSKNTAIYTITWSTYINIFNLYAYLYEILIETILN